MGKSDADGILQVLRHARRVGVATPARRLLEQVWEDKVFIGLRCDLSKPPPAVRPAKLPVKMEKREPTTFDGFRNELADTSGDNYLKVLLRTWYCRAGVRELYVATTDDGDPIYAQWLVWPEDQQLIPAHLPGREPPLPEGEVLLEGAYTFEAFRGQRAMADGMAQLVQIARERGARSALTYVWDKNVPSLRGCASVGFTPDHARVSIRRLGIRRTRTEKADNGVGDAWRAATAPREQRQVAS